MATREDAGATLSLTLEDWLERTHALGPLFEHYRDEGEQQRRLPRPLFLALREAGLFSLWVPRSLGGHEVDLETSVQIVEALSRMDGSVGWNVDDRRQHQHPVDSSGAERRGRDVQR